MKTFKELSDEFWENDRLNGSIIKTQYDEIKDKMINYDEQWIENRVYDIKMHAIKHTSFYNKYACFDEFPVVNKNIILDNYEAMLADSGFDLPVYISSTSGSTGTPFKVNQNNRKRKRTIADLKAVGELAEYKSHERMVFFRALHQGHTRSKEQEDRENIYYIDSANLGTEGLESMYLSIIEKNPVCLLSYSSTLVELAKYIHSSSKSTDSFCLKSVITIGEGISEENRQLLEKVFLCKVYRRYSDMELGIMAQDNGDGKEYRLNFGSFYFECLKMDSDEPAEMGEVGRIVVTDLFNYAQPMIRYDTGDIGIFSETSEGVPVLKEIYGRQRDCVYSVDGNMISPAKISVSMWGMENIRQWQFIQKAENDYLLRLNVEKEFNVDVVIKEIKNILGTEANVKTEYVDDIPVLASGKRKAVICEWKNN